MPVLNVRWTSVLAAYEVPDVRIVRESRINHGRFSKILRETVVPVEGRLRIAHDGEHRLGIEADSRIRTDLAFGRSSGHAVEETIARSEHCIRKELKREANSRTPILPVGFGKGRPAAEARAISGEHEGAGP